MTKLSNITKDGELISEKEWKGYIISLRGIEVRTSQDILKEKIIDAVRKRIPENKVVGLLFSGGVDSTVIAAILKSLGINPICFSVGVESHDTRESPDLISARSAAHEIGLEHREIILDLDTTEKYLKKVIALVGADIVNTGVGTVVYAALKKANEEGVKNLFTGLGSEEIFAGYQRHREADDINKECWKGLVDMHQRDLVRDFRIAEHLNLSLLVPYLDKDVIIHAMQIPGEEKISSANNKLPIRKIALDLGIPERFADRKKSAAQYGSNMDKAIAKLAKLNGFKYKKDYLESLK